MNSNKLVAWLFILLSFIVQPCHAQEEKSILFVGNSLTYYNDLPKLVEELSKGSSLTVKTTCLCSPNYALEDHLNEKKLQTMVATDNYDYVIVQQGPSSRQEGRDMLIRDGATLKELCLNTKTRLAFYMVWPSKTYFQSFNEVIQSYTLAAEKNEALLCKVGAAWKIYFEETNDYSLYSEDGFHPSRSGSFLAAWVICAALFPDRITNLPYSRASQWVTKKQFLAMKSIVTELTPTQ